MNRNKFQQIAKRFRAGKLSLEEFTQQVLAREGEEAPSEPTDGAAPRLKLPHRADDGHKGDFGRTLVIGGSVGMAGAAALSGLAALRSGAGLVTVGVPQPCLPIVASFCPCLMTVGLESSFGKLDLDFENIIQLAEQANVVAFGPGLGSSQRLSSLAIQLFQRLRRPLVIDADGINGLADNISSPSELPKTLAPRILTPHPGEFQRLTKREFTSRKEMCLAADKFAQESNSIVVLKGRRTHITDGERTQTNLTGNSGMATAGSGDVLTGVIAALLGQKLEPFEAATSACYLHGLAGDIAAEKLGQHALIATDLIDFLPQAFVASGN